MNNKFTLPISSEYVNHWGLWQAIRELIQNAYDQEISDPECKIEIFHTDDWLYIHTSTGRLEPSTLILGNTSKKADDRLIGVYGEGYKLALLVLCRLGHTPFIHQGKDIWAPKIEYDEQFKSDVLNIHVSQVDREQKGVLFCVGNLPETTWTELQENLIDIRSIDTILRDPSQEGRVYVGGLFVAKIPEFKYGYALSPKSIKLDRDRGMVKNFDLSYLTSLLWAKETKTAEVYNLTRQETMDVRYLEYASTSEYKPQPLSTYFHTQHGESAVPVSSQDEVERATKAGVKWILVPQMLKNLLKRAKEYFIPSTEGPIERLESFVNRTWLSAEDQKELKEILNLLKGKLNVETVAH